MFFSSIKRSTLFSIFNDYVSIFFQKVSLGLFDNHYPERFRLIAPQLLSPDIECLFPGKQRGSIVCKNDSAAWPYP